MKLKLLLCIFLFAARLCALAETIVISPGNEPYTILEHSILWNDAEGKKTFPQAQNFFKSATQNSTAINTSAKVHWLKFSVLQNYSPLEKLYITIPFTDYIDLYISHDAGKTYQLKKSGDLVPLLQRQVKNGQMVFIDIDVAKNRPADIILKLESRTKISQQFRNLAVKAVRIYTSAGYTNQFTNQRIYQAVFYGALAIMMFYNLFLSLTISSRSYRYYVVFLFFICIFLASNSGYLFELFWPQNQRLDLYIRFLSTPLLLLSYLFFSEQYLHIRSNSKKAHNIWLALVGAFCIMLIIMLLGYWKTGRNISIILAITSFVFVLAVAIWVYRKGFLPARYFILADILLLSGGIVFALSRFNFVVHSPFTQYSVQIAVLLQVALLSLGLADRINLVRKNLAAQVLENERLKLRSEQEQKQLIEVKNIELQTVNTELETFIYRTSHDIRGPLARLLGLSNLGLEDVEDKNALEYLQKIQFTAQTMDNILRRLNEMHEIAQIDLQKEPIDFRQLLTEITEPLQPKNIAVKLNLPQDLVFESDRRYIKFILQSLVENAFKFQDPAAKNPYVQIDIEELNNNLRIHVIDNGIGISAEEAPYLFQMFSSVGNKYKNTGLGLYKVKKVLEKNNGSISLIKDPENRTHFLVELPG
ncbi:MAG: sensor histidine kinase [Bacteroidia bacterium]